MSDISDSIEIVRGVQIPAGMVAGEALKAFIVENAAAWNEGEYGLAEVGELVRFLVGSQMEVLDALGRSGIVDG